MVYLKSNISLECIKNRGSVGVLGWMGAAADDNDDYDNDSSNDITIYKTCI